MQLNTLTDEELLRWAHTQVDTLTSTELETELLRRFEERTASDPLLDVLRESEFEDSAELRKQLERIASFDQVLEELKGPLASLQQLVTPE